MAWPTTSRQSRGYGAAHDRMRKRVLREEPLCAECRRQGRTSETVIADHIVPKAKGGGDERANYQGLCQACSDAKTAADKGYVPKQCGGVDARGRPTDPAHPWNRNPPPGPKV